MTDVLQLLQLVEDTKRQRSLEASLLHKELAKEDTSIKMSQSFRISLPKEEDHRLHVTGKVN